MNNFTEGSRKKNIEPTNGYEMLKKSMRYHKDTQNRIAYDLDTEEFIVFERTDTGSYSGHVRAWSETENMLGLNSDMKEILIHMGLVDEDGNRIDDEGDTSLRKKNVKPTNGKEMMQKSVRYSEDTENRIAYDPDTEEFIIFQKEDNGRYSGHVLSWNETKELYGLTSDMKKVLIDMDLVDEDGKKRAKKNLH